MPAVRDVRAIPEVHPVWTGSLVTGYQFVCLRLRCRMQRHGVGPAASPVYPDEAEAKQRALDHWNTHEQECGR